MARRRRPTAPSGARRLIPAAAAALALGAAAGLSAPHRPAGLLIRTLFDRDARRVRRGLEPFAPAGVTRLPDIPYTADLLDPHRRFDVYVPDAVVGTRRALPTVVWVHGGAWISGDKRHPEPYLRLLASHGYTVVAPEYPYGPEARHPAAPRALAAALGHLRAHAERFHVEADRLVLAGDSAGAQLAAQAAAVATDPAAAAAAGLEPALPASALRGVALFCGVYDPAALADLTGILGWGFRTAVRAYTGHRDVHDNPELARMNVLDHVGPRFPPALVTGGDGDGLTATQSRPLAARLREHGVPVDALFFDGERAQGLPHEYQFLLERAGGREAAERLVAFLGERLS